MTGRFIGGSAVRPMAGVQSSAQPDESTLAHMVGQIYDAAVGQEEWAVVLRRLSAMFGGTAAVLHRFRSPARAGASRAINTDPINIQLYDTHYHKTEPKLAALPQLPATGVFIDRTLVPEAQLTRTEYYNDFLVPQDLHSSLNWFGQRQGVPEAGLSLWRPRHWADWGEEQAAMLSHLSSHFRRAMRLEQRLATADVPTVAVALAPGKPLTVRERDCLGWIARGASSKEAARRLALSAYTVNEYVAAAMRKLQAASRSEAVAMALARGLIDG